MTKTRTKRARGNGEGSLAQDPKSKRWIAHYFGADGRRRKRSTCTTNRRDASEMLAGWTKEIRDVRAGLIDPDAIRRRDERARPLREHIREYFECFKTKPRTKISIAVKKHGLRKLFKHSKRILRREPALSDFTPDLVRKAMKVEDELGLSARSCNGIRKEAIALANWLTREEKADLAGFGKRVDRFCEELDRRRERRILTDDELARLFQVARARGRILFYALAYYAGFRRGELGRATWADIDLEGGIIRVRNSKAGRLDDVSIHPALAAELYAARPLLAPAARGTAKIFPTMISKEARLADYIAAEIPAVDADGKYADLHSLRATLCTRLLRGGQAPTIVKELLRHANLATTLKHYNKIGLFDARAALATLPTVGICQSELRATGTDDRSGSSSGSSSPAKRHETAISRATLADRAPVTASAQVATPREDARRTVKPRVRLLSSRPSCRFSSIGEDPFA